jgi:hypothetical protein
MTAYGRHLTLSNAGMLVLLCLGAAYILDIFWLLFWVLGDRVLYHYQDWFISFLFFLKYNGSEELWRFLPVQNGTAGLGRWDGCMCSYIF